MSGFKKFLLFFLMIFTFAFSLEKGEESKVILNKKRDVAELKIGVTKLKSKELPLEFHAESRKIYGEIDIDDNDLIFVSETLDEMPSVSTTNGRKSINNIRRYLTKNIKKAPNFEYRIVDKKDETDRENDKKYLLIDCKEQLSGVYVYVVEKETYKVKDVYKGTFVQLLNNIQGRESYGTIYLNEKHPITSRISKLSYNGNSILINGKAENSAAVEGAGGFPKKYSGDLSGRFYKGFRIKVNNIKGATSVTFPSSHYQYFETGKTEGKGDKIINMAVNLYGKADDETKEKVVGKLRVVSNSSDDYLNFEILLNYLNVAVENEIAIEYGNSLATDGIGSLNVLHTDKFIIKIDSKPPSQMPPNTKGTLTVLRGEELYNEPTIIKGKDDTSVSADNPNADIQFEGNYLKTHDPTIFEGQKLLKITVENRNKLKHHEKTFVIDDGYGNIESAYGETFDFYDVFGVYAGKLSVNKVNPNDEYFTLKIEDYPKVVEMVNSNIILQYISRPLGQNDDSNDEILKEDVVNLYIKPIEQNIPGDVHGKLILSTTENLKNNTFYISGGQLRTKEAGDTAPGQYTPYDLSKARYSNIPMRFKNNLSENVNNKDENWVYWGHGAHVLIEGPNVNQAIAFENINEGSFITHDKEINGVENGWIRLEHTDGTDVEKGFIQFNMGADLESLTIGFRGSPGGFNPGSVGSFELEDGKIVDSVYRIKYQANMGTSENEKWITIKEDTINIVINPNTEGEKAIITLSNPLVYYDYDSSSAISNVVHNKRAHLSGSETKTLASGGSEFNKNTDLDGKDWIETNGNIMNYTSFNNKHKISIRKGSGEVIKWTENNGRTPSSTFVGSRNSNISTNSREERKNEVMFSYDGGNKYLNFGLSKYDFEGENIEDVTITHYGNSGEKRETYTIKIPKFEGIHYVNPSYDIKPRQSYTKDHVFDHETGNKPITIDYGTVGFRNLDTRITEQSGGQGIEIRAYRDVILQSVSNPDYIIKGAELYFEDEKTDGNVTYFKGTNEKATSKLLKLYIPTQETLIPKDKFKILRADTMGYPLEVGVTVKGDTIKYYTPIDNESRENKGEGENLYLNLASRRFAETIVEFENPDLSVLDENGNPTTEVNWIRLNKKDYSGGKLQTAINNSDLWGRVRGEVIDIPVEWEGKKFENLKLLVFKENADGNEEKITDDLTDSQFTLPIPEETGKNFLMKYGKGNNYIEFSLDKGYSDDITHKDIIFYIRYMDGDKFLFDQRYTVRFKKRVDYLGDTTLIIKNPAMVSDGADGAVLLKGAGESAGKDNSETYDKIKWYEIQNPIDYKEKHPDITDWKINKINGEEYSDYKFNNGIIQIGLPDNENDFNKFFNLPEYKNGKEVESSFSVSGTDGNGNEKSYRLNILIEEFDPRYYGKVFPQDKQQNSNQSYNEINETGTGSYDLTKYSADEKVYIDLGTNYRDYSRYMSIIEALNNNETIKIGVKNNSDVEVAAKDNGNVKPVKGKIVFEKNNNYMSEKQIYPVDSTGGNKNPSSLPEEYSLKLELTQEEYRKLKPYTKYELFLNGNQNVLTFQVTGNENLNKEMIFDKPLSFETAGPKIKIIPEILDFGQIKPKEHKGEPLITKSASANIKVIIEDGLAKEFTTVLEPETDEIWISKKNGEGETVENVPKLKVRSITVESEKQNSTNDSGQRQDDFTISGVLEVPNKTEPERGEYTGHVTVNFTYY